VDGRTDAVAAEMVLGEPDGVVAGLVHDVYSFHCTAIDRLDWEASFGPAEELQYAKFHSVFPVGSTCRRPASAGMFICIMMFQFGGVDVRAKYCPSSTSIQLLARRAPNGCLWESALWLT